jgi:hypothetical protein
VTLATTALILMPMTGTRGSVLVDSTLSTVHERNDVGNGPYREPQQKGCERCTLSW